MSKRLCRKTPRGGDGTIWCQLEAGHGPGLHVGQGGLAFAATGAFISMPSSRNHVVLKKSEWRELRKRVQVLLDRDYDHIPDKPDWPNGSVGASVQKLRRVLKQIDERLGL